MTNNNGVSGQVTLSATAAATSDPVPSPAQRFYSGACVLVTGGTGFMGQMLIEKLLWTCPDLTAIYVLVRDKKALTGQQRIDALVAMPCFDRLRRERGTGFERKLVPISGDVAAEGLGIGKSDRHLLTGAVNVVFHVAASVRFNEPLHVAVLQNVRGTRDLLDLCKACSQLKAVVHVSTAFANCPHPHIKEQFYETTLDCDQAIKIAATNACALGTPGLTDKMLGMWPNTYLFTKALAEAVVRKHGRGMPVCVFRPGIVLPSIREPCEGWMDGKAGTVIYLSGVLTGYIRVMPCDRKIEAALVPCDMTINAMIAAAWDTAQQPHGPEDATVIYNFTSYAKKPITWSQYSEKYTEYFCKMMPSSHTIWLPKCIFFTSPALLFLYHVLYQTLPAALADLGLMLAGKKPFASRLFLKIQMMLKSSAFFMLRQWTFEERNVPALWKKLDQKDKQLLDFDMKALDWDHYIEQTSLGIRKFMLKEDPATIPAATIKLKRMKLIGKFIKITACLFTIYYVVTLIIRMTMT